MLDYHRWFHRPQILAILATLALTACEGIGVPTTTDPYEKLKQAEQLYESENRPILAERLIIQAIDIFQKNGDQPGLAEAYRQYAFLFRSPSYALFSQNDPLRQERAIAWFKKSEAIWSSLGRDDKLSNLYYVIAGSLYLDGQQEEACSSLDHSLEAYHRYMAVHPDSPVNVPPQFKSFEDGIAQGKKAMKCG